MIVISKSEMDAIFNRKIRKRTLELLVRTDRVGPARHPKTGRVLAATKPSDGQYTKRCPLAERGSYTVVEQRPLDELRAAAAKEPTRARSILWWIKRCEQGPRTIQITVLKVERLGPAWIVRFALDKEGDVKEHVDTDPVFLARSAGYTTASDEIHAGEVLAPLEDDLKAARKKAREGIAAPQRKALDNLASEIKTCREVMQGMKARNRLALALKEVERARAEITADDAATVPDQSVCAVRQVPVEAGDEPRPYGTDSVVSLESAA